MIEPQQFRLEIIRPVLAHLELGAEDSAETLLLGTAVTESGLCYLRQHGGGPALGAYQIEPASHVDVYINFLDFPRWFELRARVRALVFPAMSSERQLICNLAYATAIARIIYWRRPEPLPALDDLDGLAGYWKNHFNTRAGAGRRDDFLRKAGKYLLGA